MKFALLEVKMTLVKLLRNFEIHHSSNGCMANKSKLEILEGQVRRIKDPLNLVFKKR